MRSDEYWGGGVCLYAGLDETRDEVRVHVIRTQVREIDVTDRSVTGWALIMEQSASWD